MPFLACSRLSDSEDDAQVKGTRKYEHVIWDRLSHSLIDLFHNGGLLMYSNLLYDMIISLSDLFSMCKIQKKYLRSNEARKANYDTEDSQEDIKVIGRHIERGLWKSFLKQVGGAYAP